MKFRRRYFCISHSQMDSEYQIRKDLETLHRKWPDTSLSAWENMGKTWDGHYVWFNRDRQCSQAIYTEGRLCSPLPTYTLDIIEDT